MKMPRNDLVILFLLGFVILFFISSDMGFAHIVFGATSILLALIWPFTRKSQKATQAFYYVGTIAGAVCTFSIIFSGNLLSNTFNFSKSKRVQNRRFDSIAELYPTNHSKNVSLATKELLVKFNQDMAPLVSIGTSCNDGVCYTNASWRDSRTLVIEVIPSLSPHHLYEIQLGYKHPLETRRGSTIPSLKWEFQTI